MGAALVLPEPQPLSAADVTGSGDTAQLSRIMIPATEHVILLHGLARTRRSMTAMERGLARAGYTVWNTGYPSRSATIQELAETVVPAAVARCRDQGATTIHFVTHSMGGILVRSFLTRHAIPELGRVVMLAPPNQGSEVVDRLGTSTLFRWINGPAGQELGTGADSVPNRLGPATVVTGVIAGNRSINGVNSLMIPGPDDGKVSVRRTRLEGMADHVVVPCAHPFIMRSPLVLTHTLEFLRRGNFQGSRE